MFQPTTMKENIEKRVVGLFVLMLGILVYVAWTSLQNIKQNIKDNDWVNHTHDVIIHTGDIFSYLNAGDAALRTYLLTGDDRDKQGYRVAYSTMKERLDEAEALTRTGDDEQALHQGFLNLQNLISDRIDVARATVKAREEGGLEAVRQQFGAHPDVESISKIERSVNHVIDAARGLLRERDKRQHLQALTTRMTVCTGLAVDFVLLTLVLWLIRDDVAARRQAAHALEEANAQLESKVAARTAELVDTNNSLKQENLERRWSHQALDHQLRYNLLIINSIAELVIVISRALNVSRVNPAVSQQTGWEPQELISQSIDQVLQFPPDPGGGVSQNPLTLALRDGRQIQDRPALLLARAGKTTPVRYSLFPLHDQDKIVGGVVTVRVPGGAQQQSQS
jgi:PAS domain S-box-containing protein